MHHRTPLSPRHYLNPVAGLGRDDGRQTWVQWKTKMFYVPHLTLHIPQCVAATAFLSAEPVWCFLPQSTRGKSSHAQVGKPKLTKGFRPVTYPHLIGRSVEAVAQGVAAA